MKLIAEDKKCVKRSDSLDLFAAQVPQLNFEGRTYVHTSVGLFVSFMVYLAVSVYSGFKFVDLYKGNAPNLFKELEYGTFGNESAGLRLADTNFRFKVAFTVKQIESSTYLQDRDIIEWEAVIFDGNLTHKNNLARKVPVHKCTENDYADLYAPSYSIQEMQA
jgi:hypothetical protein